MSQNLSGSAVEVERLNDQIEKSTPQTGERQELIDSLFEEKKKSEDLEQKKEYLTQKLKIIIKEDAQKYKIAFKDNKPWPDPEEAKQFELKKSFDNAKDKEWNVEKRIKELKTSSHR